MERLFKRLLRVWFQVSINDSEIDEGFILELSRLHLIAQLDTWRNKYLLSKYEYCIYRFKEIHGTERFYEFATRAWKELDAVEIKSKRRIKAQLGKFFKGL